MAPLAFSPAHAAEIVGCSRSHIYELLSAGELPGKKLGNRTIILHDDLVEYLNTLPDWEAQS